MILDAKTLAYETAKLIYEKKGEEILIIDLEGVSIMCDYFVIATGASPSHNRAIASYIEENLKEVSSINHKRVTGKESGSWILLDYGEILVHLFLDNMRQYYKLEELWKRGKILHPSFQETSAAIN